MSEYESLREDIAAIGKALDGYSSTAVHHLLEQSTQIDRLWADNAELRDELHAVANRVEALTRARLTEPAEVAEAMRHARTGRPLVLAGAPGDSVDCVSCRGSGTTPMGGKCKECDGFGQVRHA